MENWFTRWKNSIQKRKDPQKESGTRRYFALKDEYQKILAEQEVSLIYEDDAWKIVQKEEIEEDSDNNVRTISEHNYYKAFHNAFFKKLPDSVILAVLQWMENDLTKLEGRKYPHEIIPTFMKRKREVAIIANSDDVNDISSFPDFLVDAKATKKMFSYLVPAALMRVRSYQIDSTKIYHKIALERLVTTEEKLFLINLFDPSYDFKEELDQKYKKQIPFTPEEEKAYATFYYMPMWHRERKAFEFIFDKAEYAQNLLDVEDGYFPPFKQEIEQQQQYVDQLFQKYYSGVTLEQFYEEQINSLGYQNLSGKQFLDKLIGEVDEQNTL